MTMHMQRSAPIARSLPAYLPELDGIRAVAVIGVLLYHLKVPWFDLGWTGVFLFFTLLGFLITGILLDAKQLPNCFKIFYARRSLRIFPIYYLVFFGILLMGFFRDWAMADGICFMPRIL